MGHLSDRLRKIAEKEENEITATVLRGVADAIAAEPAKYGQEEPAPAAEPDTVGERLLAAWGRS
jgi:hypothetical protein